MQLTHGEILTKTKQLLDLAVEYPYLKYSSIEESKDGHDIHIVIDGGGNLIFCPSEVLLTAAKTAPSEIYNPEVIGRVKQIRNAASAFCSWSPAAVRPAGPVIPNLGAPTA